MLRRVLDLDFPSPAHLYVSGQVRAPEFQFPICQMAKMPPHRTAAALDDKKPQLYITVLFKGYLLLLLYISKEACAES